MPSRAGKVCGFSYCHKVADSGERYCTKHSERKTGWQRGYRGTATERGYGYQWTKLRKRILERDRYLCMFHLNVLGKFVAATEVDHIVNKAIGGDDSEDNLQAMCHECHQTKTQSESLPAG